MLYTVKKKTGLHLNDNGNSTNQDKIYLHNKIPIVHKIKFKN